MLGSASSRPEPGRRRRGTGAAVPVPVVALAVLGAAFFALPLLGLLQQAAWSEVVRDLGSPEVRAALRLSLECSLWATALATVLGVPVAWVLARGEFRGRSLLRALVLLPMVLPPVVGGVALLAAFGRTNGLVGPWLFDTFGIQFTFSKTGVVLAETFVAMPFLVLTVEGGWRALDARYEDAAATLGAGRWTTFRRVTLRLLGPSLAAGAALAWARALGEFGATITFAGNVEGRTRTTPLAVYLLLDTRPGAALALSLVLLAVSVVVLVALRDRWFGVGR
ncbi:MAG: ABC transporter permease [Actinomycetota bacterium]